jgi:hypothetical protein
MRHRGERRQVQRLVEALVDGLEHAVHAPLVLGPRIGRCHSVGPSVLFGPDDCVSDGSL